MPLHVNGARENFYARNPDRRERTTICGYDLPCFHTDTGKTFCQRRRPIIAGAQRALRCRLQPTPKILFFHLSGRDRMDMIHYRITEEKSLFLNPILPVLLILSSSFLSWRGIGPAPERAPVQSSGTNENEF